MRTLLAIILLSLSSAFGAEGILIFDALGPVGESPTEKELNALYNSQVKILKNKALNAEVEKELKLKSAPAVTVRRSVDTSIFRVEVTGLMEAENEKYLNTLLDRYFTYRKEQKKKELANLKALLEKQLAETADPELKLQLQNKMQQIEVKYELEVDTVSRLDKPVDSQ